MPLIRARGPSFSGHRRWGAGGAGRGEERGGAHAISRETGDQEDARRAGLLVQLRLRQSLLLPLQPPDFASEPAPGLRVRRRDVARPGLRKRAVPAEAERGLRPRPVRARQGGAHTPDSVRWRRWRLEVAAAA